METLRSFGDFPTLVERWKELDCWALKLLSAVSYAKPNFTIADNGTMKKIIDIIKKNEKQYMNFVKDAKISPYFVYQITSAMNDENCKNNHSQNNLGPPCKRRKLA